MSLTSRKGDFKLLAWFPATPTVLGLRQRHGLRSVARRALPRAHADKGFKRRQVEVRWQREAELDAVTLGPEFNTSLATPKNL
jgi:hypothetical protein